VELPGTAINAGVVVAVGAILGWLGKGRIDKLEARIDRLEARLDERIDRLEERLEGRIDSLRSDLTRVALAVGVRPEASGA
jgi:chaperonin cofactor prefoldin